MNKKLIAALCATCCLSILNFIQAQELVTNAGGYVTNTNTSLGWSVGQVVINTFTTSGAILTQGFHQADLIITSIDKPVSDTYQLKVYPNPTNSLLLIRSDNPIVSLSDYEILIYDMQGQLVLRQKGALDMITIDMMSYAPSVYLLKVVSSDNIIIQTFHIIKH